MPRTMFTVLSMTVCHDGTAIARVHPVHLMNAEQRQLAADLWSDQSNRLERYHPPICSYSIHSTCIIAIYYYSA